ncbi:MAG: aminopeptidase P family protein [Planctomycetes bacterium]|nr:aminopeptidase P family protein [Planctomycetota bacterium]
MALPPWSPAPASLSLVAASAAALLAALPAQRQPQPGYEVPRPPVVLSLAQQREAVNRCLEERLERLLPRLMRECGVDMWIVANREYNEDPVYRTLVPAPVFAARRTTILVFFDRGEAEGVERLTVSRYGLGELYESAWDGGRTGSVAEQWQRLGEVVAARDPRRIAVDTSDDWAVADGLSAILRRRLEGALGERAARLVSAEQLCVRWFETRTERELELYPQIVQLARGVIAEAFSSDVITPGVTTCDDVRWWLRERFQSLGLPVWFHPICDVQRRRDGGGDAERPFLGDADATIHRGDVLHCDVGIRYLRLCTDTQEMGYVLRGDEHEVPAGLVEALRVGNRWQDLLTSSFVAGRTGNQVLAACLERCASEGVRASVYTHPLGCFGHAPGPTIGMWDNQGPTPVRGDWPLHPNTCYAIEGNVKVQVPEWGGQWLQIGLEQDACFDGEKVWYLGGRQTRWHVIR